MDMVARYWERLLRGQTASFSQYGMDHLWLLANFLKGNIPDIFNALRSTEKRARSQTV